MKKILFLIIISLVFFAPCCNVLAENEEPYARDEKILQTDELPPAPSEVTEIVQPTPQAPEEKPVPS
ncbi:MAG: hypothetical protein Q8R48_00955, partial [Candidatus Omnitrophota bacterium]|nr:hypothetical protein [Candidatus Omnitrophota bacterium]